MRTYLNHSLVTALAGITLLLGSLGLSNTADAQIFGPAPSDDYRWMNENKTVEKVAEGRGWMRLRRWESTPPDPNQSDRGNPAPLPAYEEKLMVTRDGMATAPMPVWAKNMAMDEFFPEDPAGPSPDWENARPVDPFDWIEVDETMMLNFDPFTATSPSQNRATKTWTKTWNFNEGGAHDLWNYNNSSFQGALTANVPINGVVTAFLEYKTLFGIFRKWKKVRLSGNLTIDGSVDLTGELSHTANFSVNHKVLQIPLYNAAIADVFLKLYVGFDASATISGQVGVTTNVDINGDFFYECSNGNGCTSSSNFNDNYNTQYSLGIELEARAEGWARAEVEGEIAWGVIEAGVQAKGFIAAELWGYYGNTCGDGDGDGTNEFVRGLTAGAEAGYDIDAFLDTIFSSRKRYDLLDDTFQLGWWDLLGTGGSTALEPMVLGPDSVMVNNSVQYNVKMRPCYPYEDTVNFTVTPNMTGGRTITGLPNGSTPLTHTFPTVGSQNVTVNVTGDTRGRDIDTSTSRTISVTAVPDPPVIVSHPSSVTVDNGGTAELAVSVDGAGPFTYQWRKNGANLSNGGHYSGVNTNRLTISNASESDEGSYSVRVSNASGQVTSNSASVNVNTIPSSCSLQSFNVTNHSNGLPEVAWNTNCPASGVVSVRVKTSTVGSVQSGCELNGALWDGSKSGDRTVDYMSGGYNDGCPAVTAADFWVQLWDTSTNSEISSSATKRATYNPPPLPCDIETFSVTNRSQGQLPIVSWTTSCEGTGISVQVKTSTTGSTPAGCGLSRALWDGHKNGSREASYMSGGYGANCPAVEDASFWVELWNGSHLIRRTNYEDAHYEP